MRLPSKLLDRVRVGVGVGAVVLGGCDLVDDAKAEVLGEPVAGPVALEAEAAALPEPPSPEPLLLTRSVSEVVSEAREREASEVVPPVRELARPSAPEAVGPRSSTGEAEAFVPYDDGRGVIASAPSTPTRPKIRPRPRPRPREEPATITPDEPCDPALVGSVGPTPPLKAGWECMACGRG